MTKRSMPEGQKAVCIIGKAEREIHWSLALFKEQGEWKSRPVCNECRRSLIAEARAREKFVKFFPLKASSKEAGRRNGISGLCVKLIDAIGESRAKVLPLTQTNR